MSNLGEKLLRLWLREEVERNLRWSAGFGGGGGSGRHRKGTDVPPGAGVLGSELGSSDGETTVGNEEKEERPECIKGRVPV